MTSVDIRPPVPRWHWILLACVVGLYLLAVITGATTSSLAMPHLTTDPTQARTDHWGTLQSIRSDEYNIGTPIQLSMLTTGGAPTLSPLDVDSSLSHRYPIGPIQTIVFWDTLLFRLGPWLPQASLFAAHWWLPTLLVLLCMPTWFVLMGGSRQLGWLAGTLVVLSPDNFWWSLQPTMQTAYVLAGCTAMLAAARRFERGQRAIPIALCLAGGICIAGMPSNYLLWSMLLGGGILLASSVELISQARKASWTALVGTGLLALLLGLGVLFEGREGLRAITQTVYPGSRRSSAAPLNVGMLFGAPNLSALATQTPVASNASELSTSFNVTLLLIPLAWLATGFVPSIRRRLGEIALALWGWIWLIWGMATLGNIGQRIPIFSSVPPVRAAQSIGVVGIIALLLALSHMPSGRTRLAALAAAATTLLTLYSGSTLQQDFLPQMRLRWLFSAAAAAGICAFLLFWAPRRWFTQVLIAILAGLVAWNASPIQFGLADMRGNATADYLQQQGAVAREKGQLWASDSLPVDALMVANGVPTLSGFQRSGPNRTNWTAMDPAGQYEQAWNRGGGYSNFHWTPGEPTEITSNGFDVISTAIDPCDLGQAFPNLTHIVSVAPLSEVCLRFARQVRWSGTNYNVYDIAR